MHQQLECRTETAIKGLIRLLRTCRGGKGSLLRQKPQRYPVSCERLQLLLRFKWQFRETLHTGRNELPPVLDGFTEDTCRQHMWCGLWVGIGCVSSAFPISLHAWGTRAGTQLVWELSQRVVILWAKNHVHMVVKEAMKEKLEWYECYEIEIKMFSVSQEYVNFYFWSTSELEPNLGQRNMWHCALSHPWPRGSLGPAELKQTSGFLLIFPLSLSLFPSQHTLSPVSTL